MSRSRAAPSSSESYVITPPVDVLRKLRWSCLNRAVNKEHREFRKPMDTELALKKQATHLGKCIDPELKAFFLANPNFKYVCEYGTISSKKKDSKPKTKKISDQCFAQLMAVLQSGQQMNDDERRLLLQQLEQNEEEEKEEEAAQITLTFTPSKPMKGGKQLNGFNQFGQLALLQPKMIQLNDRNCEETFTRLIASFPGDPNAIANNRKGKKQQNHSKQSQDMEVDGVEQNDNEEEEESEEAEEEEGEDVEETGNIQII